MCLEEEGNWAPWWSPGCLSIPPKQVAGEGKGPAEMSTL